MIATTATGHCMVEMNDALIIMYQVRLQRIYLCKKKTVGLLTSRWKTTSVLILCEHNHKHDAVITPKISKLKDNQLSILNTPLYGHHFFDTELI